MEPRREEKQEVRLPSAEPKPKRFRIVRRQNERGRERAPPIPRKMAGPA
jgi:hypothetical protein